MTRKEWNRTYYLRTHKSRTKGQGRGYQIDLVVKDLLKVNPKIMRKQIYKASELKRILMT